MTLTKEENQSRIRRLADRDGSRPHLPKYSATADGSILTAFSYKGAFSFEVEWQLKNMVPAFLIGAFYYLSYFIATTLSYEKLLTYWNDHIYGNITIDIMRTGRGEGRT